MSDETAVQYCSCVECPGFVHWHIHTTNSRLDGMIDIPEYVEYCMDTPACPTCGKPQRAMAAGAISDHGIMSGALEFYTEGKKKGFNAIIGQEIYLVDDHAAREGDRFHEGLFAMDWQGYQNLVHLSSVGFTEGLRRNYFACIDDEQIEAYSAGIICLSGCISSRLARTIMGGHRQREALIGLGQRAITYKQDPSAMLEVRRKAQRIAQAAVAANGVRKNRLMGDSQALHAELDQLQSIIASDGVASFVMEQERLAEEEFHRAWRAGENIVERRLRVFGDRYRLETQIVPLDDQKIYNEYVRELSAAYDIPCVVTADAHYLRKEDADLHRQMLRIRTGRKKSEAEPKKIVKIEFKDAAQADAVMNSSGTAEELGLLYDEIILDEMACIGKVPRVHTKKYAEERAKWVKNATLYFLQNVGDTAEELESEDVGEDGLVSVDAIDPGRPFSEWLPEFYVRTPHEMLEAGALPDEMWNTVALAERCKLEIPVNDDTHRIVHMPHFEVPQVTHPDTGEVIQYDFESFLAYLCVQNLRDYLDEHPDYDPAKYHARLAYEMDVIGQSGFSSYFLIVWDYINAIRENGGLTGPGRGSAAASLITFLLGVTKVIDPVRYPDLMFERFLTPGRPDLPDIDTDIDFESAGWVFEYCARKYGEGNVAKIGTFSVIGVKQALKDIGRVLDVDFMDVQKAAKFFSEWRPDDDDVVDDNKAMFDLQDVVEHEPELQALRDKSDLNKQWFRYANQLVGKRRNVSQHASGVAIASENLQKLGVPLLASYPKKNQPIVVATQFDMDDMAKLGVPKFDQLKLSSLNTIAEAERLIGSDFSIENIPLDDAPTFRSLSNGDNLGIFQVAQPKLKGVLKTVRPNKLSDIAAVITIIRPGLFAKDEETGLTMEELYKARRSGSVPVRYMFPFLEPITSDSQGIMIYQEQVLKVLWESGMTPLEADKLRKILSKKQMSKAKDYEGPFVEGIMRKHGLLEDEARALWALIVEFAAYGFNAAHAYAYGLIAYWTSYLKTHYPGQFMAASLTVQSQKTSKAAKELIPKLLEDCGQLGRGLEILPPSVNRSQKGFTLEMKPTPQGLIEAIRFGLGGIKGVASLADHILAERMNGKYVDFEDFDRRLKERTGSRPNKTALVSLAYAGAFDDFFGHRSKALWAIEIAREDVKYKRETLIQKGWEAEKASILAQRQAELCGNYYFVRDNLEVLGTDQIDNFFEKLKDDQVRIGGRVVDAKLDRKSKNGKPYHRATIKTQWGDITVDFYAPWRSDDPASYLQAIKGKLFDGSVVIVSGQKRDEGSMFGKSITLPKKQFQGQQREDPHTIAKEAQHLLSSTGTAA